MALKGDRRPAGDREATEQRKAEIVALRRKGTPWDEIGQRYEISLQRAHQIWKQAIESRVTEEVSLYRKEQVERLDALLVEALQILNRQHPAVSQGRVVTVRTEAGDVVPVLDDGPRLQAIKTILSIEERRAKLLGLDSPSKAQVETNTQVNYVVHGVSLDALK